MSTINKFKVHILRNVISKLKNVYCENKTDTLSSLIHEEVSISDNFSKKTGHRVYGDCTKEILKDIQIANNLNSISDLKKDVDAIEKTIKYYNEA